ncbi:MAG: hypothetical protein M1818_007978 [Claussenomyces sp. TS43310]|nr:MAG: hypothetical protein M1818_007978 [Claussenomyces sp. TS43310]
MCLQQKFSWPCGCTTSQFVHSAAHKKKNGIDCRKLVTIPIRVPHALRHKKGAQCASNIETAAPMIRRGAVSESRVSREVAELRKTVLPEPPLVALGKSLDADKKSGGKLRKKTVRFMDVAWRGEDVAVGE